MKKLLLTFAALLWSVTAAFATCTGPAVLHDFPGTSFNMSYGTNAGDGNCSPNVILVGTPSVTANAGTNLNTSLLALETGGNLATIATNSANLNLAIGSTTSGQKGNLVFGAVTTAAPTYTTAQSAPISLTTAGLLRVDGSGVTQPVSLTSTTITGSVAVTAASGAFASGSHAAGSYVSGSYVSGALASGAVVDITNLSAPIAAATATATKSIVIGGQFDTTQKTLTNGQQAAVSLSARGAVFVATGADTFNVTVNAALPAGTNLMGKVGLDQTTVGTTNGVSVAQIGATTVLTGNGVSGAGALRVAIVSDNSAVAGVGVGATGSAVPANAVYNGAQGSAGLQGLIICDSVAKYDASTSGSTQIVALSAGKTIYVCGYSLGVGATATNVKLVYGTGTNCVTSPTDITPAYQLAANGGIVDRGAFSNGLKTAASNALCFNASAANAAQGLVYYAQF